LKIIKLNAIDSTNSFLKELAQNSALENFTTVITEHQTKGRGQQGSGWTSVKGKNLTFSTFVSFSNLEITHQKYLNFVVSLAVFNALKSFHIPKLSIKWPNDILAGAKKISGILVENTFVNKKIKNSVIGIGLNVHQENFSTLHKKATSMKSCLDKKFELELVLKVILDFLQESIEDLKKGKFSKIEAAYLAVLYRKNVPATFKNSENVLFMGIIKGVSSEGNLQILLEDDTLKEFGIKEVSFA
jgi:BirA family biotin operon repressor/biotin-[acetyl-CoA-carboxylase] ligase